MRLVITIALKKEVPLGWFNACGIPVLTFDALRSGALVAGNGVRGMIIVVTGAGPDRSREAARWITDNLQPRYVLNVGTCGVLKSGMSLGTWLQPGTVSNAEGLTLHLDTRLPIPFAGARDMNVSLLTLRKTTFGVPSGNKGPWDIVDMECHAQAMVFQGTGVTFHCLKFGTDYSDANVTRDFNANLERFKIKIKELFAFVDRTAEPGISVVIPVNNRALIVKRALDSVLAQTYGNREVILVDDGSTDGTAGVLRDYGKIIQLLSLPDNAGPSKARNEGVKHSRNEWIAFLDSDDMWEVDKLERQVEYIRRHPFYEIMQSDEKWIRHGVRVNQCRYHKKQEGWVFEPSLERCMISPSAVLLRKKIFERYGTFDESLPVCEDYDLWLKISRHHPVGFDPALSVVRYGGHDDQLSKKFPAMDRFRVRTLLSLIEKEEDPEFREKIASVMKKKLNILMQGYEKRERIREAEDCRAMLALL